ncbi:ATP-binding protein [Pseudorhodoferax sp.]|uniref:hybrid sensor histidine kinase/response regulator n=1 Tax=Pseudorhodoferax sp. TaxID=1993553 RepID=UPI0039E321E0
MNAARRSTPVPSPSGPAVEGYLLPQLIRDLRSYQAELESQNKVLRYSQAMAEAASRRFETLFSSVPLALMVVDEHDLVVQSNSMARRSFQPTERDPPLNFLMPFVSAASAAAVRAAFALARERGQAEAKEVVFAIGADRRITGDLHIARLDQAQEPVAHFICAVIDQGPLLAERRALLQSGAELQQRNEQLRISQARLADIIDSSLDAIVCVDRGHRITVFNPAAATLLRCPPADALGSPLARFFPNAAELMARHPATAQLPATEMQALTADGAAVPVEVSVAFGDTATVFARDLTLRKRDEAQRAALEAQLRQSQKMEAVGTMAGGIAHDFNNILHAIMGNVALAREDSSLNAAAQESLREIEKAGRRARDLVRQILTFSRNEAPRRVPIDLAEVLAETERMLRVTLPPQVELHLRIHHSVPAVLADKTQVGQAVLNLGTNAVQAIQGAPEGRGAVWIDLQRESPGPARCARLGLAPGVYARVSVRDDGPGMDAATLERIFEPFFTTKQVGQGTGLGLAVVHGVMRSHGGAVDVQSAPGRGSRFMLYFPATDAPPAPPAATAPASAPAVAGTGQHVMYVDDDEALVFMVRRLLDRRGFRVTGFTDPHAAAAALRENPQAWDLVVTDYNMPGYCGVDLVREARGIRADLPVALASGYVTAEIEREALAEGARALIHKPNDVQELCATVQRLLQENA